MTDPQTPATGWAAFAPNGPAAAAGSAIVSLDALADVAIALASIALVAAIWHLVQRRADVASRPLFGSLAAFAAANAAVRLLDALAPWHAAPALAAFANALTAFAAIVAALLAWRAMPDALALPARHALDDANAAFERERDRAAQLQGEIDDIRAAHERGAAEHAHALADANTRLERESAEHRRTDQSLRYNETLLRRLHDGLEEHITERTAELTKTISELEAFSYSISHDLRAPLRAINGYAAILAAEHANVLTGEGRALLERIETNAARMAQLIDGLLDFARLARIEVVQSDVDMRELATAAVSEVTSVGEHKPSELAVEDLPPARGDAQMLRQVWVNLVANALKFSSPKPKPMITIGGEQRGDETVYWVRDNGVGFDMAYAEKLFGVFNRLHRAEEFPGVGVGLAIVRRIVTRHGGRVWAESVPGEGSTFYFTVNPGRSRGTLAT